MWTKKEQEALEFSFQAHKGQKRKGSGVDYIAHPMTVALILAKIGVQEDVLIAGILHDIIEDTDFEKEDIKEQFGPIVAKLVEEVSEDKKLPYETRKRMAFEKISEMSREAILIKAADTLANLTDLTRHLSKEGEEAFDIFNTDKGRKIEQIKKNVSEIKKRIKNEDLRAKLTKRLEEIKEYED